MFAWGISKSSVGAAQELPDNPNCKVKMQISAMAASTTTAHRGCATLSSGECFVYFTWPAFWLLSHGVRRRTQYTTKQVRDASIYAAQASSVPGIFCALRRFQAHAAAEPCNDKQVALVGHRFDADQQHVALTVLYQ